MKKFLTLCLAAFLSAGCLAATDVDLKKGNGGPIGGPIHAPALLPTLCYDGTTFTLTVPYDIDDLEIVISDANGTILYNYVGSNVTNSQPSGPVYIESGTTNIKVNNSITLNGSFEVKEGAVFSIEGEN